MRAILYRLRVWAKFTEFSTAVGLCLWEWHQRNVNSGAARYLKWRSTDVTHIISNESGASSLPEDRNGDQSQYQKNNVVCAFVEEMRSVTYESASVH